MTKQESFQVGEENAEARNAKVMSVGCSFRTAARGWRPKPERRGRTS
jgi:hypothetical protein